jgi:phosphoribosylamine--glycine ligase
MFTAGILSNLAIYDNFANKLSKEINVLKYDLDNSIDNIVSFLESNHINFLIVSGLWLPTEYPFIEKFKKINIPHFFPSRDHIAELEYNKFRAKELLKKLGIPTANGYKSNGAEVFEKYYKIPRPFVLKFFKYLAGRQTIIVTDQNFQEVYNELFSHKLFSNRLPTNVNDDWACVIEEYVNIKSEESYHVLMNEKNWTFFGSARDYKKVKDGDQGFNYFSAGAYSVNVVNHKINEYADKIFNHFQKIGNPYKGFLFFGIAYTESGDPIVLELNTRSGDPELIPMLSSITNNLTDIFYPASTNLRIPEIKHDNSKTVTIRLLNTDSNWNNEATSLPDIKNIPSDIIYNIEGGKKFTNKHSLFSCTKESVDEASQTIYRYLSTQNLGQFYYRKDIGVLK